MKGAIATPTIEQFRAFEGAYDYFNQTLFKGKLPNVILNLSRKSKAMGFVAPFRWRKADAQAGKGQIHELSINPEILSMSDETFTYEEASPNLQGVSAKVTRPARVKVRFLDADGVQLTQDFEDLWATSVQHQIDHLNGRMYFDNLSRTKRQMLLKKAGKR